MSSDLISILERDPELAEELAATPGNALGQLVARQFLKARRVEAEQRERARAAAEAWRAHEDGLHHRARDEEERAGVPPVAQPAPEFTQAELIGGIARGVRKLVDEKIGRLQIDADVVENRMNGYRALMSDMAAEMEERLGAIEGRFDGTEQPPRMSEIAELKARINEIEARPLLEDAGVWDPATVYRPGQTVTCGGSAWVCKSANANGKPGTSDNWRLMIKKGRDGRDKR